MGKLPEEEHGVDLALVLDKGRCGETYNIGGDSEMNNLDVVTAICNIMDELRPAGAPHSALIRFVKDRPGHDRRYAMNTAKLRRELGWRPRETFATGIRRTVEWYLANSAWVDQVTSGEYRQWIASHYGPEAR